jgi:hypothetical protein
MDKIKTITLRKFLVYDLLKFSSFLIIAVLAPLLRQQILTGTIVNALLFLSVITLGLRGALLLAVIPSIFALAAGLLSPALIPFIPLIMFGNIILILSFNFLRKNNFWLGIVLAALLKFVFLAGGSFLAVNLFFKKDVILPVLAILSWPQLATALLGGVLAYFVLKFFKKSDAR